MITLVLFVTKIMWYIAFLVFFFLREEQDLFLKIISYTIFYRFINFFKRTSGDTRLKFCRELGQRGLLGIRAVRVLPAYVTGVTVWFVNSIFQRFFTADWINCLKLVTTQTNLSPRYPVSLDRCIFGQLAAADLFRGAQAFNTIIGLMNAFPTGLKFIIYLLQTY